MTPWGGADVGFYTRFESPRLSARRARIMTEPSPPRYAPLEPLPPYSYVPGHGLPHPVTDPRGHSHGTVPGDDGWLRGIDLFNAGFSWEAHEAWESVWHELGRTSPSARFVQALIHMAGAAVKIREGRPEGVRRHTRRARELLEAAEAGGAGGGPAGRPGLTRESLAAVLAELEAHRPACWHTSRAPVVRVVASNLLLADRGQG